ncbi:MAG: hypothetical protein HYZ53_08465 [Planctomycetes bacterium]|nr:hypothetical protein [Planctomycetota bacterium]
MEFPTCPVCKAGSLLPLSSSDCVYNAWVCAQPACAYTVGDDVTYYKGKAGQESHEPDDEGKEYTTFSF